MYYILPFLLFLNIVITNFFYSIALSSVESAVDSIARNTITRCIQTTKIKIDSVDDIYIDQDLFEELYLEQFESGLDYNLAKVELAFAYYNVMSKGSCDNSNVSCNGVQIKITAQIMPFIPKIEKYVRYELDDMEIP